LTSSTNWSKVLFVLDEVLESTVGQRKNQAKPVDKS